jgi:hypothetical protein
VNTFDIFDTLIARKCVHPKIIFAQVEIRSGITGFANTRREAEESLAGTDYSFDDIYQRLALLLSIDSARAESLRQLEFEIELENVIPIQVNLGKVNDGDLLITDMYLSSEDVAQLLQKAGLRKNVVIYQSTAGKGKGEVWRKLKDQGVELTHLGDHPHSDGRMPVEQGFGAIVTQSALLTPVERNLAESNFPAVAMISRILRLAIEESDPISMGLARVQASYNIPLLMLLSIYLSRQAKAKGINSLLFSARDCKAWYHIFSAMISNEWIDETELDCHYFYTSRISRTTASENYVQYVQSIAKGKTLVLDICGTGSSLQKLVSACRVKAACFFLLRIVSPQIVTTARQTLDGEAAPVEIESLLTSDETNAVPTWVAWEMMNYASHGMVLDTATVDQVHFPICASLEFSSRQTEWIKHMESIVHKACSLINDPFIRSEFREVDMQVPDALLAKTIATLWQEGASDPVTHMAFQHTHVRANVLVSQQLARVK